MTEKIIQIYKGPPGCGKTERLHSEMLAAPAKYLLAVPRADLVDEQAARLRAKAAEQSISVDILTVHSKQRVRGSVPRRIAEAAAEHTEAEHVIVLVTHEGLQRSDLSGYAGWDCRIDETPQAVVSGVIRGSVLVPALERAFDLKEVEAGKWWTLVERPDAPAITPSAVDDAGRELAAIRKYARRGWGVLVNIGKWADAQHGRARVQWWSAWTPALLCQFDTVVIASAGFSTSLCHLVSARWDADTVRYDEVAVSDGRSRGRRHVRIGYFTRSHVGSTAFWETVDGKLALHRICEFWRDRKSPGYWSGNEVVLGYCVHRIPGEMVRPKQEGTNELRHHASCAFLYSNKAQERDEPILEQFGISRDEIRRAREVEDILQFVMRGAVRCPDFAGTYTIWLYDVWQAEAVAAYLQENGLANEIELVAVEQAGIMDMTRPDQFAAERPEALDPKEIATKQARERAKDADRKRRQRAREREARKASGTYRLRGRPKGTGSSEQATSAPE